VRSTRRRRWPPNKNHFLQLLKGPPASGGPFDLERLSPYIALQKLLCCYANKFIAPGIWHAYVWTTPLSKNRKGDKMSKTVALGRAPSPSLFARLLSIIDRVLMANAHIAVRNGDLPYFGL
jgi:hypothetical protein